MNKYKHTEEAVDLFAEEAVRLAQLNLGTTRTLTYTKTRIRSNSVATGTLKKNLRYNRTKTGIEFFVSGPAAEYAENVEEGTPKNTRVSVEKLAVWIRKKPVKLRDRDGRFIRMSEDAIANAAALFSKAIYERGIPGTFFFARAIDQAFTTHAEKVSDAMLKDIELILRQ